MKYCFLSVEDGDYRGPDREVRRPVQTRITVSTRKHEQQKLTWRAEPALTASSTRSRVVLIPF